MARVTVGENGDYVAANVAAGPAVVDTLRRISWGAVIAGVVISMITQFLLSMLGLGIGISTIEPASGDSPAASTFSISAAIWWTISGIISAFVGGWVAGRLSGALSPTSAALHGLVTWATATLLVLYLLTTAVGALMGGAFSFLGNTLSTAGEAVRSVAPQLAEATQGPMGDLRREVESSLQGGSGSAADKARALVIVTRVVTTSDMPQAERDQAAETMAQQAGIPPQEARERLDRWRDTYQRNATEIQARARQTAEATARVVSRAAIFGFIALVMGAIAGAFGGRAGAPPVRAVAVTD
jgi:hypothetical protein